MAALNTIRGAELSIEGRGYMGTVDEVTLPALNMQVGEHRAMGYDAPMPVDQGMEMLTSQFTISGPDLALVRLFGKDITARLSVVLEGQQTALKALVVAVMGGKMTSTDFQAWTFAGELSPMVATMTLNYYQLSIDGVVVCEIDVPGGVRAIDGFDALSEVRGLLGV